MDCPDCSSHMCTCCIIVGCIDSAAANYDEAATKHDPSACMYRGCNNSRAQNYDARVLDGDGSCIMRGCMDGGATNFDPQATQPCTGTEAGGTCCHVAVFGCTDPNTCDYEPAATRPGGSCSRQATTTGCHDPVATNFNMHACVACEANSCCTYNGDTCEPACAGPGQVCVRGATTRHCACDITAGFAEEAVSFVDTTGTTVRMGKRCVACKTCPTGFFPQRHCTATSQAICAPYLECPAGTVAPASMVGKVVNPGSCEPVVPGCMDVTAMNYNNRVNVDDGSCQACLERFSRGGDICQNFYNGPEPRVPCKNCCECPRVGCMNSSKRAYDPLATWPGPCYGEAQCSEASIASCSANARCVVGGAGDAGEFSCVCDRGFFGDGATCSRCSTCTAGSTFQQTLCSSTVDAVVLHCTACLPDEEATQGCSCSRDRVCEKRKRGCTESNAVNYDPEALLDDGTCEVVDCFGHRHSTAKLSNGVCDAGGAWGYTDHSKNYNGANFFCAKFAFDNGECDGYLDRSGAHPGDGGGVGE